MRSIKIQYLYQIGIKLVCININQNFDYYKALIQILKKATKIDHIETETEKEKIRVSDINTMIKESEHLEKCKNIEELKERIRKIQWE